MERLPSQFVHALTQTYPQLNINAMWDAAYVMMALFDDVARLCSEKTSLDYNVQEANAARVYFASIAELRMIP